MTPFSKKHAKRHPDSIKNFFICFFNMLYRPLLVAVLAAGILWKKLRDFWINFSPLGSQDEGGAQSGEIRLNRSARRVQRRSVRMFLIPIASARRLPTMTARRRARVSAV